MGKIVDIQLTNSHFFALHNTGRVDTYDISRGRGYHKLTFSLNNIARMLCSNSGLSRGDINNAMSIGVFIGTMGTIYIYRFHESERPYRIYTSKKKYDILDLCIIPNLGGHLDKNNLNKVTEELDKNSKASSSRVIREEHSFKRYTRYRFLYKHNDKLFAEDYLLEEIHEKNDHLSRKNVLLSIGASVSTMNCKPIRESLEELQGPAALFNSIAPENDSISWGKAGDGNLFMTNSDQDSIRRPLSDKKFSKLICDDGLCFAIRDHGRTIYWLNNIDGNKIRRYRCSRKYYLKRDKFVCGSVGPNYGVFITERGCIYNFVKDLKKWDIYGNEKNNSYKNSKFFTIGILVACVGCYCCIYSPSSRTASFYMVKSGYVDFSIPLFSISLYYGKHVSEDVERRIRFVLDKKHYITFGQAIHTGNNRIYIPNIWRNN